MEIKLTKRKSAAKEIELKPAKRKTAAVLNDSGRETKNAIQLQSQEKRVKRIVVLRCGTVYLQNFSKDMNEPGRQLKLIREPDNPYDRWAIRVCTLSGAMLGYLPSKKESIGGQTYGRGKEYHCFCG